MSKNQAPLIQALQDSIAVTNQLSQLLLAEKQRDASADIERKTNTVNVKKADEEVVIDEEMFAAIIEKGRPEILKLAKKLELDVKRTDKTDALIELISNHLGFELEEAEEEEEEDEVEVEEDEDGEEIDLSEMDHKELISFIEENFEDVEIPKKKKSTKVADYANELRTFIEEELLGEEAEEEVEEEEEEEEVVAAPAKKSPAKKKAPTQKTLIVSYEDEDGEEVEEDLLTMTAKELRAFAADFDVTLPTKKNVEELAQLLYDALNEDAEEEEEEEEVVEEPVKKKAPAKAPAKKTTKQMEEEYGLDELDLDELAEILQENGLSTSGKRPALVDRIIKGIEDGSIETE